MKRIFELVFALGGMALTVVGTILLAEQKVLWPLALVFVGLSLLILSAESIDEDR